MFIDTEKIQQLSATAFKKGYQAGSEEIKLAQTNLIEQKKQYLIEKYSAGFKFEFYYPISNNRNSTLSKGLIHERKISTIYQQHDDTYYLTKRSFEFGVDFAWHEFFYQTKKPHYHASKKSNNYIVLVWR